MGNPMCSNAASTTGHDGYQQIIIDGTTMKETTVPSASSDTRFVDQKTQYGFTHNLGQDAWKAELLLTDTDFAGANINALHCDTSDVNGALGVGDINYTTTLASVPEDNRPQKPCASWCFAANANTHGVCGRVLKISGLLQTYDELHMRQYGTIQEVWVQLMYAYQEGFDQGMVTGSTKGAESPFPNIFFSAPEVTGILAFCPNTNMKCRGYLPDEHQPYGGAREANRRVYENNGLTAVGAEFDVHADAAWPANDDPYV